MGHEERWHPSYCCTPFIRQTLYETGNKKCSSTYSSTPGTRGAVSWLVFTPDRRAAADSLVTMLSGWAGFAIVYYSPPRRGPSEPSPGGRFPRSPLAEVGHRRPFFRRLVVVLLCGWDVEAPRGRLRLSGARESPLLWGGCFIQDISKIQKNVTTTLAYYIIMILKI